MLTIERLKESLHYEPNTGLFTWINSCRTDLIGKEAGTIHKKGYRVIAIDCKDYRAHLLAWMYVYGKNPSNQIDHKNGSKLDNRIDNLREVTPCGNSQNRRKACANKKSSNKLGVYKRNDNGKFRAIIMNKGKRISLGQFDTEDEAYNAYVSAKRKIHSTCTI